MPFVSITRLRLRSWRFVPGFLWHALLSGRQARSAPGNLAALTLRDANLTFWTCTVWQDEAAMRAFMTSGAHRDAMSRLPE
jgi:heme-degrading monooxygenase HmoA